MLTLSSTRLDTFSACTMRYHYKYIEGLEPKVTAPELAFGSLWHVAMEAYYLSGLDVAMEKLESAWGSQVAEIANLTPQLWSEDMERMSAELELLMSMLRHYDFYWRDVDRDIKVVGTEVRFDVPILKPGGKRAVARFTGVIDLVESADESIFIWDHKSVSSFGSSWFAQNSIERQFRRYAWAYQRMTGNKVRGICINGARKKTPMPPRVNKDGKLSKDKAQDTTYQLYLEAIESMAGLDPAEYTDILDHLKRKGNTFFERDGFAFNDYEVEEAGEELYWLYRRMIAKVPPVKTPSPLCTQLRPCPYRMLCVEDTPEARLVFRSTREEMTA